MIRLILILILVWANVAYSKEDNCKWDDDIPCLTIYPNINNSNALGDKITPTLTIKKSEIQKYNLIDLPKVLNYVQGLDITQSGPTGQQSSVFLRGTNSNHTLVLLNGIPINDYSTPTGAHDVGQDFMFNVVQIDVYKGSQGAHWGADAVGGAINFRTCVSDENLISLVYGSHNTWNKTIKLGTFLEEHKTILDFRIEDETFDGISVYPQGGEHDPYDNRRFFLYTGATLDNGYTLGTIFIDKQYVSSLGNSGSNTLAYTSEWNFQDQHFNYFDIDGHFSFHTSDDKRSYLKSGVTDLFESNV